MAMMSGQAKGPVAEMNVTPMIDLLLVLIIIFMVLAVNEKRWGEEAQIPQPPPERQVEVPPDRTVVVSVSEYGGAAHVKINTDEVPWGELQDHLMRIFVSRVEKVAFVKADKDMEFSVVADVIDTIHHAGVEKVGLMTDRTDMAQR